MALNAIEAVIENIVEAVSTGIEPSITLKSTKRSQPALTANAEVESCPVKKYSFPGKTAKEAWCFAVRFRLLQLIHGALTDGVVLTKRDLYYKDPALFGSQTVVDRIVDDIGRTVQMPRAMLNVAAAAKGLFAGAVTISRSDGSQLTGTTEREGILIPDLRNTISMDTSSVEWILVVEKEAVFQDLVGSSFWELLCSEGILITGKGEPDIFTRYLTCMLCNHIRSTSQLPVPVHVLVDFDPHGLGIMSTYKYGSKALCHENDDLTAKELSWLGLRSADAVDSRHDGATQTLLELSEVDRRRAASMLAWPHIADSGDEQGWRRELQVMLMLNMKAEIQVLDDNDSTISQWVEARLHP